MCSGVCNHSPSLLPYSVQVEKMGQKVLTIKDLQHGYPTRPLFKDVDLDLEKGDRVAIIGPNGAGGGEGREGWEWRTRGVVRVGMEDPGSGKVDWPMLACCLASFWGNLLRP